MYDRSRLREEHFGILTDDNLALEASLVRPMGLDDRDVSTVQLWVPKYPLTRSSLLTAARYETVAIGHRNQTVNLTLDLRGSGESDGIPSDEGFEIDLRSAHEWAKERFGPEVTFRVLGFPDLGQADRLLALPLRPGVLAEFYRYETDEVSRGRVLYLSQYRHFSREDDALCRSLADADFTVFGGDLMRYLLPAAPLTLDSMWKDGNAMVTQIGRPLYIIARSPAAGPALALATGVDGIGGVVVTGPAQAGLDLPHLFTAARPGELDLIQLVDKARPRPVVFLWNRAEAGDASPQQLRQVYERTKKPTLWGVIRELESSILLNALGWLIENGRPG